MQEQCLLGIYKNTSIIKYLYIMDTICYTGMGSVKTGNYTKKEFLDLMNKKLKKRCSIYVKALNCKSCKKMIEMNKKEDEKQINAILQNKPYKMANKEQLRKQTNKCNRCKNKKTKKCNLKKYMLYSVLNLENVKNK